MRFLAYAVCILGFVAGTILLGWWGVPLAAAICALAGRPRPRWVGAAAALAWAAVLLVDGLRGSPLLRLADRLGGIFGAPAAVVLLLAPLFAFILGWSAATLVAPLRKRATRPAS